MQNFETANILKQKITLNFKMKIYISNICKTLRFFNYFKCYFLNFTLIREDYQFVQTWDSSF